jgi:PAS domain S-box-containing protein
MNHPSETGLLERIEEPQSEAKLRIKVNAGFALAIILTCLLSFLSWRMARQATANGEWVAHTHEVSGTLEATLRHLVDVETGGRGFALTGNMSFLEPYETGKSAVGGDLQMLRQLVAANVEQTRRLDALEVQASARIRASADIVSLRQNTGKVPTLAQFEQGKQLMDTARATIAEMESTEKRLLQQRTERARAAQRLNLSLIGLGALAGVIFLSVAGLTVSREIGISAKARAQVSSMNADLERRVEQRTAALQSEIANREEAEAKLRASEEMFRVLLDGIKDYAVYMLDAEGRVVSWNSGAARIKGYLAEEIIGKHVSCFFTETDREHHLPEEVLREAAHSGRFEGEGWRIRKDGSKFWANAVITSLYEANGALRGYSKVVRDITDRKQTEDELKKQAALLDLAHDAILVRDLQSRVIFWNRGAQHLYGWSAGEASGQVTHDLLHTNFPLPLADIEAVLTSKGAWEGELRHTTRHGTQVIVASRSSLQRNESGVPAAILEINRDITDRKRTEAALSESEGRLAGVIQSAMDAILTVDEEQRIVLFNCAAERMFRCPASEALGQPITRFIPSRFHAAHAGHIRKFGETGVTNRAMGPQHVLWAVRADGQEFQIEASISQVVIGGKKLFTVIHRDVTERVRADAVREHLAAVVDSSDDAIISKDLEGTISAWNRGAEKIFGYSAAEAMGQSMLMLFPPDRVNEESDILSRIRRGESVEHFETVRVRKDGTRIDVSVTISPIRNTHGAIIGASKIARDITERKRTEAALAEQTRMLKLVLDSMGEGLIAADSGGHFLIWNDAAKKLMGRDAADVPSEHWDSHYRVFLPDRVTPYPPDSLPLVRALRGESVRGELIVEPPVGNRVWLEVAARPISDAQGKLCGGVAVLHDITESKLKNEELRESEERFRLFIEHAPAALAMFDREMRYLHLSRRWRTDYGLGDRDVRGVSHYELFPEVPERWKLIHRRGMAGEVLREDDDRFDRPDGSVQWVRWEVRPWHDRTGEIAGIVIFAEDITERRSAEEAQRQSDARRKFALETAKLGDWELDLNTLRASRSSRHDQIFGYQSPLPQWSFEIFLKHVHPDDREWVRENFQGCLNQRKRWDFECRIVWPSGDIRWIWACGSHYRALSSDATRMFGIVEDITERKQVEEALRQKEHLLSESQRIAHLGSWTLDLKNPGGRIVWSDEMYRIYGVSPESFTPTVESLLALVAAEDRYALQQWIAACAAGERPHDLEFRVILPDGTIRLINGMGELQRDDQNRPVRMAGSAQDITERKQAEAALRESEQRFQAMANGIPQLAWMAEPDGHIFWYNQRWYEYTGTTFEEMEGWAWQSVHHPEMLAKVLERWKGSIARSEPFDMEFPLRGADGSFRMFLTRVMPLRDAEGHVTRWFGTNTDISEQKESERQLAEQAQELARQAAELANSRQDLESQKLMLQSVLDSMVEGLVVADEHGKFMIWNPAAAKIVGLSAVNLPPEQWSTHYGRYLPDMLTLFPTDEDPLLRAIRGEVSSAEMFIRNPELEHGVWVESNGAPLRDRDGVVRGGVVAFRDITQKRAAELEIRKLNETLEERIAQRTAQLESANHELESFSYSVSHDLRAPLRRILGFAGAFMEEFSATLDPQALHYVQRIQDGIQHMNLLINELLNLARTGQRSLRLELTGLNSVVEEIISLLTAETAGRDVEWKIGNLPSLECDPVLVRQIFQNLLSNAIKYSRPRPHAIIEIGHTQENDRPVIFVRDNGVGFNMQYADKLFGVFQRLHRDEDFEGTGVGLATVYRIVQKHGGRIWAEAELGRGATFYFTLGGGEIARSRSDAATAGG